MNTTTLICCRGLLGIATIGGGETEEDELSFIFQKHLKAKTSQ
jgi:hypothetical protein